MLQMPGNGRRPVVKPYRMGVWRTDLEQTQTTSISTTGNRAIPLCWGRKAAIIVLIDIQFAACPLCVACEIGGTP
jgi:hypothetical protein